MQTLHTISALRQNARPVLAERHRTPSSTVLVPYDMRLLASLLCGLVSLQFVAPYLGDRQHNVRNIQPHTRPSAVGLSSLHIVHAGVCTRGAGPVAYMRLECLQDGKQRDTEQYGALSLGVRRLLRVSLCSPAYSHRCRWTMSSRVWHCRR